MIDAHVHLDRYGEDLPRALEEIRALSIRTLAVSMDIKSFQETQRIAEAEPLILPAFGVHPWKASRFASDLSVLEAPLEEATIYGEIGLDFHFVRDKTLFDAQRSVFEFFLDAAERTGRLINVHTKGAEAVVIDALKRRTLPAVIVHWYSGPLELVDEFLDLGAYFTVGVEVTRSPLIQSLAATLPLNRLLTETDNPGGWDWMAREVGFPELMEKVEGAVAETRGVPRDELSAQVDSNFQRVLRAGGIDFAWG
jgi:TatD DNase family protein